jgi:hypothetical protein
MAGTGPYHRVVDACSSLPYRAALIDGEVIVQDENGLLKGLTENSGK